MATGDNWRRLARLAPLESGSSSAADGRDNCDGGSAFWPKSSHINKSTSATVSARRDCLAAGSQRQRQVSAGVAALRRGDAGDPVGELLQLTYLRLSDDQNHELQRGSHRKSSSRRVASGEHEENSEEARARRRRQLAMLTDGAGQYSPGQQQQPHHAMQSQPQPQPQESLSSSASGAGAALQLNHRPLEGYHAPAAADQLQHQQASFGYAPSAVSGEPSYYLQPQIFTPLEFPYDEFVPGQHQQPQLDQDEAPQFYELESRLHSESFHVLAADIKQESCDAAGADLNHHHHLQQHHLLQRQHRKVAYEDAAPSCQDALPESVIRINEPPAEEAGFPKHANSEQQQQLTPQSSFSSVQLSLRTSSNLAAARPIKQRQQQQLEQSEFHVCAWENCGNTFDDMQQFVKHLEDRHVNQVPREKNRYFCLWANCKRNEQEFNARYKLLIHMRVHSGEKPYPCDNKDCAKTFSRLENLKIHQRSHTGQKPYKCSYASCSKSFTNSSDRIKHHKTHRDPRPYCCSQPGCSKRYTDPSSLRKHLRAHKRLVGAASGDTEPRPQLEPPPQAAAGQHFAYAGQQQQQQLASHRYQQPPATIIDPDYDPCAMLYEHEQQQLQLQQPSTYLAPEATYSSNQAPAYEQPQQTRGDTRASSLSLGLGHAPSTIHHHNHDHHHDHHHDHDHHHHHDQQQQQQQQHLAVLAESHSQFSRSWCAGSARPRESHWGGGSCGSREQLAPAACHHSFSFSSSSLDSNCNESQTAHCQQQQQPHLRFSCEQEQQQQQRQPTHRAAAMNFSRPFAGAQSQTREAQHQLLMRSLPAQPARAFRERFAAAASASACCSGSAAASSRHSWDARAAPPTVADDHDHEHRRRRHEPEPEPEQSYWRPAAGCVAGSGADGASLNRYEPHG